MAHSGRVAVLMAAAGLASAADAQINWSTQMQFRNRVGGVESPPLPDNQMSITATGTYTFTVQVGIVGVTGLSADQANYGLNNWTANVGSSGLQAGELLGVTQTNARVTPFNFGPATTFAGTLIGGGVIANVNAARDVSGGASAPWLWDSIAGAPAPLPTVPTNPAPGADAFASVWRFQVHVATLTGPDIFVTFVGQSGPVIRWVPFSLPLAPDEQTPAIVTFIGITPTPVLREYPVTSLVIRRVPTPGAAGALIGAMVWMGGRRRAGVRRETA